MLMLRCYARRPLRRSPPPRAAYADMRRHAVSLLFHAPLCLATLSCRRYFGDMLIFARYAMALTLLLLPPQRHAAMPDYCCL